MFCRNYHRTDEVKPNLCFFSKGSPFDGVVGVLLRDLPFSFSSSQQVQYLFIVWIFYQLLILRPVLEIPQFNHFIYLSISERYPPYLHKTPWQELKILAPYVHKRIPNLFSLLPPKTGKSVSQNTFHSRTPCQTVSCSTVLEPLLK